MYAGQDFVIHIENAQAIAAQAAYNGHDLYGLLFVYHVEMAWIKEFFFF